MDRYPYGYIEDAEAQFLEDMAASLSPPGLIVEIGAWKGKSTVALGRGARGSGSWVISIDNGTGSPEWGGDTNHFHILEANLKEYGVSDMVALIQGNSHQVAASWEEGEIALLWIDGSHLREAVEGDVKGFLTFLRPDGILVFHDYYCPAGCVEHPDVSQVVNELFPGWEEARVGECFRTIAFRPDHIEHKAMKKAEPEPKKAYIPACPECGGTAVAVCRCIQGHAVCEQGHVWDVETGAPTTDAHRRIKI